MKYFEVEIPVHGVALINVDTTEYETANEVLEAIMSGDIDLSVSKKDIFEWDIDRDNIQVFDED